MAKIVMWPPLKKKNHWPFPTHHSTTVTSSTPSHPSRALSLSRNQFLSCLKTHLEPLLFPTLHNFPLSRFSLLLSLPASFNQYSSRTNANKHLRIHHHLRVLVSLGLYKDLLYFTYFIYFRFPPLLLPLPPWRIICLLSRFSKYRSAI